MATHPVPHQHAPRALHHTRHATKKWAEFRAAMAAISNEIVQQRTGENGQKVQK